MGVQTFCEQFTFVPSGDVSAKGNIVAGIFQKADTRNANGRVYRRSLWERLLKRPDIRTSLADRNMLGELGHPDIVETTPVNVSHIVTKLELRPNGDVYGEAEILDTPSGRILKTLYEAGVKMGISSRGYLPEGSCLMPENNGDLVVPDDFELVTFDFVLVPSTPGANPTIKESQMKKLTSILSESRGKVNPDVVTFIEGINQQPGMKVLHEAQSQFKPQSAQEPSSKIIYKEGIVVKEQTAYIKKLEAINKELVSRYKVAESALSDLIDERKSTADVLDDITRRYLTAEAAIREFADYSRKLESSLAEVTQLCKVSEGVIEDLRGRYLTSEGVIDDMSNRLTLGEAIINDLVARHTLSEQTIASLKAQVAEGSDPSKTEGLEKTTESVLSDIRKRYTLSEGIIREMADQLAKAAAPKQKKPVPAGYFEGIAQKYGVSLSEAKRVFKEMGCSKKAFEFHLEEKKRLTTRSYSEFPYMQNNSSVMESDVYGNKSGQDLEEAKLARLVSSQF